VGGEEVQAGILEEIGRKLAAMEKEPIRKSEPQSVLMDKTRRG